MKNDQEPGPEQQMPRPLPHQMGEKVKRRSKEKKIPRTVVDTFLNLFWQRLRPSQMFIASFLLLIVIGMCGLMWLPGLYTGEGLTWLDALFTSTSAVCVTGLIVVDTATYFTQFGQVWILILIQLGGLGMITLASLIIIALDQRLSLRTHALATGVEVFGARLSSRELVRRVVKFTLYIELVGAFFLWVWWSAHGDPIDAIWPALFHSISAFCNAGFSVWSDSLTGLRTDTISMVIIMALIVLGGIGFVVMSDLRNWWQNQGLTLTSSTEIGSPPFYRLSLHTRITVVATLALILIGWILFTIFEWHVTLAPLNTFDRIINGLFLSVTSRTAGFNTVDYGAAADSTNFLTILLMGVGGSPGSTAGGLKTTTVALIVMVAWAKIRGRSYVSFGGRTIPEERVQGAVGLFTLGFFLITIGIFAYFTLELPYVSHTMTKQGFLPYMFEAVSAFNTVGLSMGITPTLGITGKVITIIMMFMGRVGPLALVAAFAARSDRPVSRVRYAKEDVMIG